MKPKTIEKIRAMLTADVQNAKEMLINAIENGYSGKYDIYIEQYRDAFNALEDFEKWVYAQEDD